MITAALHVSPKEEAAGVRHGVRLLLRSPRYSNN